MSNIFFSYSHKDEAWKNRLEKHLEVLEKEGNYCVWNDRDIKTGADWLEEITAALNKAKVVIMLISKDFLTSKFILEKEVPLILQRRKLEGVWVIPLVLYPCAWKRVSWLAKMQMFPVDGKPLSSFDDLAADELLVDLAQDICEFFSGSGKLGDIDGARISLSKMPGEPGAAVFGREKELEILDKAWNDEHCHIVILQAWGGVGKTALVNYWLNLLEQKNYHGAAKVYAWSFYSQGAEEGKQASADEFFQETLQWFGDQRPEQGANVEKGRRHAARAPSKGVGNSYRSGVSDIHQEQLSTVEKGRRLAALVRQEKNLIILDGLEPIQYPPGAIHGFDGKLKDAGLSMFLKELAADMPGLCVITTREKVQDLQHKKGFAVKEIELENLSETAGVQLLKNLGVTTGSEKDFRQAVKEYGGHALTLTLLGNYIKKVFAGDIRKGDEIGKLAHDKIQGGRHAHRVMAAYESWLGVSPERDILYMMGLFDRPVEPGAIEALKQSPAIPGVTDKLQGAGDQDWQLALSNLREAGLLAKESMNKPGMLDAHPLVREYFGDRLKQQNPKGWQQAHKRLYEYYKALPQKEQPDTLQEMEPLFAAIAHGSRAGLHQETLIEVYYKRIQRDSKINYCCSKLGAFGADLAALSHFFEVPWSKPAQGLNVGAKADVLNWAAFRLRALGRLMEAAQPMQASFEMAIKQTFWKNAANAASSLSELLLTLGEVSQAVAYARQSVEYADRSGDEFQKYSKRTTLADALHQAGKMDEAEKLFLQAEAVQKESQPQYPFLYSQGGYRFCDLLLGRGRYKEALNRAEYALKIETTSLLLDIGLNNLALGRAWLLKSLDPQNKDKKEQDGAFTKANEYLDQAVAGLRKYGSQQHLPRGLLARAAYYRTRQQYDLAEQDLAEALEIAELGSMKLYLVDYHLESGRLCRAAGCNESKDDSRTQGRDQDAQDHFQQAAALIKETGYHRRDEEIEEI